MHWQRWRRHGDPLTVIVRTRQPCSIDGCDAVSVARTWCNKHWRRWKQHGDPLGAATRKPKPPCSLADCDAPVQAKGYCQKHYQRLHHAEVYREQIAAKAKAYRDANADKLREYRKRNADRIAARNKAWNEANPEKRRELDRAFRAKNPHKIRQYHATRRAVENGAEVNDLTAAQWSEIKAAYGHRCAYCHKKSQRLTQDHVVPLSRGGHHTASNVVPACKSCNSRKGAREAPTYQPLLM